MDRLNLAAWQFKVESVEIFLPPIQVLCDFRVFMDGGRCSRNSYNAGAAPKLEQIKHQITNNVKTTHISMTWKEGTVEGG